LKRALDYIKYKPYWGTGEGVKIAIMDQPTEIKLFPDLNVTPVNYNGSSYNFPHGTMVLDVCSEIASEAEYYTYPTLVYNIETQYIKDLEDCIKRGVDVVNMSFSIPPQEVTEDMIEITREAYKAGIKIVTSSGNTGDRNVRFPGDMDEEVIAVGAISMDTGEIASYTTRGEYLEILAPSGVWVRDNTGEMTYFRGTSTSSPIVASSIAVFIETYRKLHGEDPNIEQCRHFLLFDHKMINGYPLFEYPDYQKFWGVEKPFVGRKAVFQIGNKHLYIYDCSASEEKLIKEIVMDIAPTLMQSDKKGYARTMIPLRFAFEAFGLNVEWVPEGKKIIVRKNV